MRSPDTHNPAVSAPALPGSVRIRRWGEGDSYVALTAMLHRAYARQLAAGLQALAGRQDEATTRRRCQSGECHIAVVHPTPECRAGWASGLLPILDNGQSDELLAGAILLNEVEEADFPPHFLKPHVAHFSLFAVDPTLQGRGIGCTLLRAVEARARELAAAELALSMADPDAGLHRFYAHRGYRFIEFWQWPYTNYRSAILSKPLGN